MRDIVASSRERGDIAQSDEVGGAMLRLRKFMFERVYLGPEARSRARPRAPDAQRASSTTTSLEGAEDDPEELQRVTDYIAGMTDRFAIATFRRVALPEESRL